MANAEYIPALRYDWLTRFYDFFLSVTFPEKKIKAALIATAQIKNTDVVLDFGVGTATLSLMIKEQYPEASLIGVDVDEKVLKIAAKKSADKISLLRYDGNRLPFEHNHFDKIISSLVFHHIPTEQKKIVLPELSRVLKPGDKVVIADFGTPANWYTKLAFGIFRRFDGEENTRVNAKGQLPAFISEAGFTQVQQTAYFNTAFGTVVLLKATKT